MEECKNVRQQIQTGDCVLTKGSGVVSKLIRLFTDFSHAMLVIKFDEYDNLEDRIFLLEASSRGNRFVLLSDVIDTYSGEKFLFKPNNKSDDIKSNIQEESLLQVSSQKKYDYSGLFRNIFGRISLDADEFFCSELVWYMWLKTGLLDSKSNLTETGLNKLNQNKAPRPGDIPKWVHGKLMKISK